MLKHFKLYHLFKAVVFILKDVDNEKPGHRGPKLVPNWYSDVLALMCLLYSTALVCGQS